MKKVDFIKKLENLKTPDMNNEAHKQHFKMYLLNARKTGLLGLALLILPFFFVFGNILEYGFKIDPGIFGLVPNLFFAIDKNRAIWLLGPLLLMVLPVVAVILNLLSIIHVFYEQPGKELVITMKVRWLNIFVVIGITFLVGLMLIYLITENLLSH